MGLLRTSDARIAVGLAPVLAGIAASAALAIDYTTPAPVFCAEGGGCDALKHTAFASVFGVATPLIGLAGFFLLGVATLTPGALGRRLHAALSGVAAAIGGVLLAAQIALGHLCPYCCVADASAIASGAVALRRLLRPADGLRSAAITWAGAVGMLSAAALPAAFAVWRAGSSSGVPAVIREEWAVTPPGRVTIVDFVDFECPYCRMTHAALRPVLDANAARVRLVRRQVPLHIHPHAADAARAACCAERLGKGDAMADALFEAPVEELTPAGCESIAARVGLPLSSYRACVADPQTDARIEADRAEFKAADGHALPTLWIGRERLVGAQPSEALERAVATASRGAG